MIYTYDYDTAYLPAMPVIEIKIGRALATPSLVLTALIDSGSDGVIIPLRQLRQIRARKERKAWLRTVGGVRSPVDLYSISLQFGPFAFSDLVVAGGSQPQEVIIGRDILNQFIVTLNGLASVLEIAQ
jgi:hypothetical protein